MCSAILRDYGAGHRLALLARAGDGQRTEADITAAQQETQRLHSVIMQVQQFEQRKTQLQQRVTLIEQLRKEQIGPVHMLDQISLRPAAARCGSAR